MTDALTDFSRNQCPLVVFWVDIGLLFLELCLVCRFLYRVHKYGREYSRIQVRANAAVHLIIPIYTLGDLMHAHGSIKTGSDWLLTNGYAHFGMVLADLVYFISFMAIYGVLLHRLWISFKDSTYSVTRKSFTIMGTVAFIQTVLFAFYMYLLSKYLDKRIDRHLSTKQQNRGIRLMAYVSSAITLTGYVLNGYLVFLFVSKLQSLVQNSIERVSHLRYHHNAKLLFTAAKHTVIGIFLVFFSQLFFTTETILWGFGSTRRFGTYAVIFYVLRSVEGVYDMWLLDLAFAYSNEDYTRYCRCCHRCISGMQMHHMEYLAKTMTHKPTKEPCSPTPMRLSMSTQRSRISGPTLGSPTPAEQKLAEGNVALLSDYTL